MMEYKKVIRFGLSAALTLSAVSVAAINVAAQDKAEVKAVNEKSSGRDPFKKYQLPPSQDSKGIGNQVRAAIY